MKVSKSFLFLILFFSSKLVAQHEDHAHDVHAHDIQHHHRNEIGIGNTAVYLPGEQEFAFGLHIHYVHTFKESRFGAGFGYERIFDEHGHNMLGLIGSLMLLDNFILTLSPGLMFEDEASTFKPAVHIELNYEFSLGNFHLGPTIGIAYLPEHYHLGAGIHLAYGF